MSGDAAQVDHALLPLRTDAMTPDEALARETKVFTAAEIVDRLTHLFARAMDGSETLMFSPVITIRRDGVPVHPRDFAIDFVEEQLSRHLARVRSERDDVVQKAIRALKAVERAPDDVSAAMLARDALDDLYGIAAPPATRREEADACRYAHDGPTWCVTHSRPLPLCYVEDAARPEGN